MICPNLTEARGITGEESSEDCAAWLREHGVLQVAVKLGRDGAFVLDEETSARVASFRWKPAMRRAPTMPSRGGSSTAC